MAQYTTLHIFRGQAFNVAVRQNPATGEVIIAVLPSDGSQWEQLHLFEFQCKTSAEAVELSQLMRSAAAMAGHVEGGGQVENWRL